MLFCDRYGYCPNVDLWRSDKPGYECDTLVRINIDPELCLTVHRWTA